MIYPEETAHEASLRLDARYPWLADAFAHGLTREQRQVYRRREQTLKMPWARELAAAIKAAIEI